MHDSVACHGNLLVPGIAVAHFAATYALLEISPSPHLLILAACVTSLVYHPDRAIRILKEDYHNHQDRVAWILAHPDYRRTAPTVPAVKAIVAAVGLPPVVILIAMAVGLVGILHGLPAVTSVLGAL